jgi:hypothetical protein
MQCFVSTVTARSGRKKFVHTKPELGGFQMFKFLPSKQDRTNLRRLYSRPRRGPIARFTNRAYTDVPITPVNRQPRMKPFLMTEEMKAEVLKTTGFKPFHERTYVRA